MATGASLAFPPGTGGVELYEGMTAFWTEASRALAHATLPKTQVLERNAHKRTGTSIKSLRVCYINVEKSATWWGSVRRPRPKQTAILMWGDYGRARTQTVRPVRNAVNSLRRHQQASQLASAPLHSILPQHFL